MKSDRELTIDGRSEDDEAIVQELAVTLQGDLGIIGELEFEVVSARLKGTEEERVRRFDGKVVEKDQNPAI